jgi:hypothetical protein
MTALGVESQIGKSREDANTGSDHHSGSFEFDLQTRDAGSNRILVNKEIIDPRQTGIIIIDPWNYHWCMTAAERVAALEPRENETLAIARRLGMLIMWAPSDVASQYVGTRQRERSIAAPYCPLPPPKKLHAQLTAKQGKCLCGPGINCLVNFGWDAMNPALYIDENDLIISGLNELNSHCKTHKLEHLIYMGDHTNVCVLGKEEGLINMASAMKCILARDCTDAITHYDPETGYTPDDGTAQTVADIERAGVPTINLLSEFQKAGVANDNAVVELVRISPWGQKMRPYQFYESVIVTLTTPWLKDVEIRYTTDDTEPVPASQLYTKPIPVDHTTFLRTAAFRGARQVSLPSDSLFVRLGPVPPKPDIYLDAPKRITFPQSDCRWNPNIDHAFHGGPLLIRKTAYSKGMGMRAPANLVYEVQPHYKRFVALAGVDDWPFQANPPLARYLAMHSSVQFQVYIDGEKVAESPVMRISQVPWRFDVPIPSGSRRIDLVITDAGSRSPYDTANWVDAGFVLAPS